MSWLLNLYDVYEKNLDLVGKKTDEHRQCILLPVSHTTQNAHIEVNVTKEGNFHSATVVPKENASTIIPATEDSSNRAGSKIAPYPLHDKLMYVSNNLLSYEKDTREGPHFQTYIKQLENWVSSPYSHTKVKSIYNYLIKETLIEDLIEHGILFVDENNQLIKKWSHEYEEKIGGKPEIFSVVAGDQSSAFVRFNVYSDEEILDKVWEDISMYDSFVSYYQTTMDDNKFDICYVTGNKLTPTTSYANKIRHAADKAKLISGNDTSGFTFRGRFTISDEVANISYEVSQKAHNALKWLIRSQGKMIDGRVFLVWENALNIIPDPIEDTHSFFEESAKEEIISFTNQEFAREVSRALDGYKMKLSPTTNINILVLDAATTGRMSIMYYRNLDNSVYFDRLKQWHQSCAWLHRYKKGIKFFGAPALKEVAFAAYGSRASDKLVKGLVERMLPCIIDGRNIPNDIIRSCFYRSSNPVSMEKWEWEKTLSITCSLINKQEGYDLALDKNNLNRDYLFGRLLAVADVLERRALNSDEGRATNAIRYMNAFTNNPERTWKIIQTALQPYQVRLGNKGLYLSKIIDDIASKIPFEEFNNKPLSGKYLLGFYSQRYDLYTKKNDNDNKDTVQSDE